MAKEPNLEGCLPGIFFLFMMLILSVYFTFFNRYCLRGLTGDCERCPHVTIWEYLN